MHTLTDSEAHAALKRFEASTRRAMFYMDSQPEKARKILADMLESVGADAPKYSATRIPSRTKACEDPACPNPFCTGPGDWRHMDFEQGSAGAWLAEGDRA